MLGAFAGDAARPGLSALSREHSRETFDERKQNAAGVVVERLHGLSESAGEVTVARRRDLSTDNLVDRDSQGVCDRDHCREGRFERAAFDPPDGLIGHAQGLCERRLRLEPGTNPRCADTSADALGIDLRHPQR